MLKDFVLFFIIIAKFSVKINTFAGVMELADVVDSKSTGSDTVPVRVRPPAPKRHFLEPECPKTRLLKNKKTSKLLLF